MAAFPGSFAFDEYGRPFIILRDQFSQKRLTGNDAIKVRFFILKKKKDECLYILFKSALINSIHNNQYSFNV